MKITSSHIGYLSMFSGTPGKWDTFPFTREDLISTDPEKQRDVQGWLNGLDEPWSDTAVSYRVHPSYETGCIPEQEAWVCDYTSIVYDGIEAHLRVCAATPNEALTKCQTLMAELLNKYYIKSSEDEE